MRKVLMVVLVSFLISGSLFAEEPQKEERSLFDFILEPVKMILAPIKGGDLIDLIVSPAEQVLLPVFNLGEVVVTPGRTQEYIFNVNKNVSVIDSKEIKDQDPGYIQRMIATQAGVSVNGYFGNPKDNSVDMRGFGEAGPMNYVVLVDGRRTNQIDMSGPDLSQIDINSIDRIEIIRGANSVMYGDNATGGVINIITKKGTEGDHIEYKQEFGSYRYNKEYFSAEGGHDFLDYFFSYSYQNSDGYRLNGGYEANDIFTSFLIKPDDFFDIRISSEYHRDWYGQTGALYDGNIVSDGRRGSRFPDSKAKTEDWYILVDPRVYFETDNHEVVLSVPTSYRLRRSNSLSVGFNNYETNHHISSTDLRPKCEVNSILLDEAVENKFVCGADYFYARDEVLSGDITFAKSQVDIVKETFGIYAADNMLINKRFILSAGVRGEWAKYIFDQEQPAMSYDVRSPKEIAFDAGIGYKYNERSQIYASYARSYRFPATDEVFQSAYESFDWLTWSVRVFPAVLRTDLKHQVGNNYEVGIKDNSFESVNIKCSYYLIDNKNEIYYDPISFQNENYKNTIHHGLELEVETVIWEKIKAFFQYTFQKAFFIGDKFASNTIPLVPENKISAGFTVEPIDNLILNLSLNYVGSRFMASDQMNDVSKLESYTTMDLAGSYQMGNVRIFGSIKNVLDENYYLNATRNWQGNPAFYPAPEVSVEGGVAVLF